MMLLGGLMSGAGEGIVAKAEQARQDSLIALKRQWQVDDRADERAYTERMDQQDRDRQSAHAGRVTDFLGSLYGNESGGRFDADNGEGYVGRGQFGQPRLDDFTRAHGLGSISLDQFKADENLQQDVEKWHWADIRNYIAENNLDSYVGTKIKGTTVTESGMLAAAHLGGKDGLRKYLESGGGYDPADSNGTRLSTYMGRHGGRDLTTLFELIASPDTTAAQRDILQDVARGFGVTDGGSKLTNPTWIDDPDDPTREIRVGQNERGQLVPFPTESGEPASRAKRSSSTEEDWTKVKLSSAVDVRLGRALANEFGEADEGVVDAVKDEMRRLITTEGMTEADAERSALDRMVYEETERTEGSGWFDGPERTVAERGPFTGEFRPLDEPLATRPAAGAPAAAAPAAGGDAPTQQYEASAIARMLAEGRLTLAQARTAAERAGIPESEVMEALPQPQNAAEFQALPSGAHFIDPEGQVRRKP